MTTKEFEEAVEQLQDTFKYKVDSTGEFDSNLELMYKQGKDLQVMLDLVTLLARGENTRVSHKTHKMKGSSEKLMDSHLKGDWVLLWKIENNTLVLTLVDTGSHSHLGLTGKDKRKR
jgi:mRNA interferase YafQ